jgi:hypothetical protein
MTPKSPLLSPFLFTFILSFISIFQQTNAANHIPNRSNEIESYTELIQDTLFSNSQQLTSFQYIFTRDTHFDNQKSTQNEPFVLFPQQIYDLMMNTPLQSFDYATTQGQWDSTSWGWDYTGIYPALDVEQVGCSFYQDKTSDKNEPTSRTNTMGLLYNNYNTHTEPQPHAGKLLYNFATDDLAVNNFQNQFGQQIDQIDQIDQTLPQHFAQKASIKSLHTTITQSLSNLVCSALSQIKLDSLHVLKDDLQNNNNNISKVTSFLPVESLCTEHIVSLRKLIPNHSAIPSATTIFHSNYISFRITAQFIPNNHNNHNNHNNGPKNGTKSPKNAKIGQVQTTISLTYVKNIAPHDQTHTETTNIATTAREIHEIPRNYQGFDAVLNTLLQQTKYQDGDKNNNKNTQNTQNASEKIRITSTNVQDSTPLELSAFLRPHKPNRAYLEHQAYIHLGESGYHFGQILHDDKTVDLDDIKLTNNNDYINEDIITTVFDKFNTHSNVDMTELLQILFFNNNTKNDYHEGLFLQFKNRDLINVNDLINKPIRSTNAVTVTHVPRWMCAFVDYTSTQFQFEHFNTTNNNTDNPFQNSCNSWIISLFDPLFNLDMTKPQFIHPTLPNVLQLHTVSTNGPNLITIVIHREALLQYLFSNQPITFASIFLTSNNDNNANDTGQPAMTPTFEISNLEDLYGFFSRDNLQTLSYTMIYYNPQYAPIQKISKNKDAQLDSTFINTNFLLFPSATSINFLSPSLLILSSPSSQYSNQHRIMQHKLSSEHDSDVKTDAQNLLSTITLSRQKYYSNLINSLLSTLLTNNNLNTFNEKLYLQSNHHLYWNLLSYSTKIALKNSHNVIVFQQKLIEMTTNELHWPVLNSPCGHSLLLVNSYNDNVNLFKQRNKQNLTPLQFLHPYLTFTPRPTKDSLFVCPFHSLLPQISPNRVNQQDPLQSTQKQTQKQTQIAAAGPNSPSTLPFQYMTKYSLLPNLQSTRHFTSMALDSTEFVIDILYTPQDYKHHALTNGNQQVEPNKTIKLVKQTSTLAWQVGDVFIDQLEVFGHYTQTHNHNDKNNSNQNASPPFSTIFDFFQNLSSFFLNKNQIKKVPTDFITKSVIYDHQGYKYDHHHNNENGIIHQKCQKFQNFISIFEQNNNPNQSPSAFFEQNGFEFNPLCVHITATLGQQRNSPTTITTYFMLPEIYDGYREIIIKVPILKALFRVSESPTDIARGIDIVAGTTKLLLIDNEINTKRIKPHHPIINQYTLPTSNTSMLVPYPDASMPFNATAIVSTIIAFAFGSIFNILYNSDFDFLTFVQNGKLHRIVSKFQAKFGSNGINSHSHEVNINDRVLTETPPGGDTRCQT